MPPFIVMIPNDINPLNLLTPMDYGHLGQPFVFGSADSDDLTTMDYGHLGQPLVIQVLR